MTRPRFPQAAALQGLAASLITFAALAVMLNGTLFSSYSAPHVDFSINFTAAHAIKDGDNPYGLTTLRGRAETLDSPTNLMYSQLFTSYIQPPTSAISLLPITVLPWRDASRVYLAINHVFLFAAVALTLYTLRPRLQLPWLVAGSSVIIALFSQVYASFSLGQVDATLLLLFSIAFWAYCRDKQEIAGAAIAIGAAIKLVPAFLLLYFLWKRQYRAVAWGAGVGLALFLASLAYAGTGTYETYFTETLPALAKGSTHYANASMGAAIARWQSPEVMNGLAYAFYLDEVPSGTTARIASAAVLLAGLAALAIVIPRRLPVFVSRSDANSDAPAGRPHALLFEYYLIVAVTLIVSSVTWEFYVVWLLPVFLVAFLAPERVLPSGRWRWLALAGFVVAFVGLNYPGDLYVFDRNGLFYHPEWVPGVWVEDRVQLYHQHLDAILYLRLSSLVLLACLLGLLTLRHRRMGVGG